MIIAGTVVGSAGTLLTQLMAKAMNRSLGNVLFSGFGDTGGAATGTVTGSLKPIEAARRRRHDGLRPEGDRRARLRHGGRAGAAQDLGAVPAAHRSRRDREVRDPPGGRPHARTHERAAGGSRRALRSDRGPGRDQRGVRDRRRRAHHRRQRRRQPGGAHRQVESDLRHADPERRQGEERHRHQARPGRGLLRHRERALLSGQHAHAVRRCAEGRQRS